MHPSLSLLVVSPTAALVLAFVLGNGGFVGGEKALVREVAVSGESLLQAVKSSDEALVGWLLDAGAAVDSTDGEGRTALMLALDGRDPGMAHRLLGWGADPLAVDGEGGTVLYHAIRQGEVSVVKELLDRGATGEGVTPEGGSLLAYAVAEGRTASAMMLLDAGASPKERSAGGRPVAFYASERKIDWLLAEILAGGADVNARDEAGETLVHAAVRRGEGNYLPLYWSYGADANATNKHGVTPLHLAIAAGGKGLVAELIARGAALGVPHPEEGAPVLMALDRQEYGLMKELLDMGADVEVKGRDGRAAMEVALDRRDFDAAQVLASHGAGVKGMLRDAVAAGDSELVAFLLAAGANANPEGGESPLVAAVRGDHAEMALALLQGGAKLPEGKVFAGQGLFHLAMARGHREVVLALLKAGAPLNEAFAEPVEEEFVELVKSEGRIKWFLRKDRRVTPLMMAADSGDLELVRVLLEYGANTDTWTRRHSMWPINFASHRNDVPMMQVMLGVDPKNEERWVKVDLSDQMAWVYGKDGEVLFETRVSTGKSGYDTPKGSFVVTNKYRSWSSTIYKGASMPYFQRLSCGDFGLHQGYVPKYPASHGCLRVPSGNAYKLYQVTKVGDRVEIVE